MNTEKNFNGFTFSQWFEELSRIVEKKTGLHPDDFPDRLYWEDWNAGEYPEDIAEELISEEMQDE